MRSATRCRLARRAPTSRRIRACCLALLLSAAVPAPGDLFAQEGVSEEEPPVDPCSPGMVEQRGWLDWLHQKLYRTVCGSALWFDGFFGDATVDEERDATFFRIGGGAAWDGREGWDFDYRFRAKVSFPNLENRLNIFLGRGPTEALLTSEITEFDETPVAFDDLNEDSAWLLGIGYVPVRGETSRIGVSTGVRLRWPPDPYLRAYFRENVHLTNRTLLRLRQTAFWEGVEGVGTSSRLEVFQTLGTRFLLEAIGVGTISERADGVRWQSRLGASFYASPNDALRAQAMVFGETGRDVPLRDVRLRLSYRRRAFREWLFFEARGGVHWPRRTLEEERRATAEAGLGCEIATGDLSRGWIW